MKKRKTHYTVPEAARYLKIGRAGVHAAIKGKRLRAEEIIVEQVLRKRRYVISAEDLDDFKSKVDRHQQRRGKKSPPS